MSDSIKTSVDVAVAPIVAFDVFTRDIDAWYRVDTETLPDITRTGAIRFEPYLGGRLLDVHDLATGAGRELGRVTVWDHGQRLVFVDNEGSEVAVDFEPCDAGTRVTITHSGLDRLAPKRAGELRRAGWAALAPLYGDHVAPHVRPVALAIVFQALLLLAIVGALALTLMLPTDFPASAAASSSAVFLVAAGLAVLLTQDWLVRRWLPSRWQFQRISIGLFALLCLAVLAMNLRDVVAHDDDALAAVATPVVFLLACWAWALQGPARGRSQRSATSAGSANGRRSNAAKKVLLILSLAALAGAFLAALRSIAALNAVLSTLLLVAMGALSLAEVIRRHRERRTFGFDPDQYLAVTRPVSEGNQPPELLVRHDTTQPEYSGWYAYATAQEQASSDRVAWVAWSMRDLVDHAPAAAAVLREGHGNWKWDHAQRTYRRLEHLDGDPPHS